MTINKKNQKLNMNSEQTASELLPISGTHRHITSSPHLSILQMGLVTQLVLKSKNSISKDF